jgi:flagellin-like hook-associated protein FlgL
LGDSPNNEIFSFVGEDSDGLSHSAKIVFDGVSSAHVYLDGSSTPTNVHTGITSSSGNLTFEKSSGERPTYLDNINIVSTSPTPSFSTISETFSPSFVHAVDGIHGEPYVPGVHVQSGKLSLVTSSSATVFNQKVSGAFQAEFEHQSESDEAIIYARFGLDSYRHTGDSDLHVVSRDANAGNEYQRNVSFSASGRGNVSVDNLVLFAKSDYEAVATTTSLGVLSVDTIKGALEEIASYRAQNGAQQGRINFAMDQLATNRHNLESAKSRILDVDVAEESTQLARANILVQAGASMLGQANASAQIALKLLG